MPWQSHSPEGNQLVIPISKPYYLKTKAPSDVFLLEGGVPFGGGEDSERTRKLSLHQTEKAVGSGTTEHSSRPESSISKDPEA